MGTFAVGSIVCFFVGLAVRRTGSPYNAEAIVKTAAGIAASQIKAS